LIITATTDGGEEVSKFLTVVVGGAFQDQWLCCLSFLQPLLAVKAAGGDLLHFPLSPADLGIHLLFLNMM
jgi:hypothetical protein